MKANYITNRSDQRRIAIEAAKDEIKRQKAEFCPECMANMERQTISIMCKVLHDNFDFTKEMLEDLIDCSEAIGLFIHDRGDDYKCTVDWLRDAMGIDLECET